MSMKGRIALLGLVGAPTLSVATDFLHYLRNFQASLYTSFQTMKGKRKLRSVAEAHVCL